MQNAGFLSNSWWAYCSAVLLYERIFAIRHIVILYTSDVYTFSGRKLWGQILYVYFIFTTKELATKWNEQHRDRLSDRQTDRQTDREHTAKATGCTIDSGKLVRNNSTKVYTTTSIAHLETCEVVSTSLVHWEDRSSALWLDLTSHPPDRRQRQKEISERWT